MKRTEPEQIGKLFERIIKDYNLEKPALDAKALLLWSRIVGPGIDSYTTKKFVRNGVLFVAISSAPLKNELSFQREKIKQSINNELGSDVITEIRLI